MTTDDFSVERAPAQPRAIIVTVYGLYARRTAGWLAVSSLIRLLDDLGVDEPAVRSAISRLKRRGVLVAHRRSGVAGYELSPAGRAILAEGDERIFHRERAGLADGWLLAVFSVPESERQRRHQLRSRLTWLGFGSVSAGVWVAPGHLADQTRRSLGRDGLADYVDLFRAEHIGFGDLRHEVATWWDLEALASMYDDFVAGYAPVLRRWSRRTTVPAGPAFGDYVTALTAWRRLPYLDPGLPLDVLPGRWPGARAAAVFEGLRELLAGPAQEHIAAVVGGVPAT